MDELYGLTEADVKFLKELKTDYNQRLSQLYRTEKSDDTHQAPETYIALVDVGGIPALTGGATPGAGDVPGTAECNIYQIGIQGELTLITGLSRTVFNLTPNKIQSGWLLVTRDKWGRWVATTPGLVVKIGKCTNATIQGQIGTVALWDAAAGTVGSSADLVHTGIDASALFLLGPGQTGAWVIIIGWPYGYLAVAMECSASGSSS